MKRLEGHNHEGLGMTALSATLDGFVSNLTCAWTLAFGEITIPLFAYFVTIRQIFTFHS
jgi:hypothetical protein